MQTYNNNRIAHLKIHTTIFSDLKTNSFISHKSFAEIKILHHNILTFDFILRIKIGPTIGLKLNFMLKLHLNLVLDSF